MVHNFQSVKATPEFLLFIKKLTVNRLRIRLDEDEPVTLTDALSLIEKYFKNNNLAYKEMISQEKSKK